MSMNPCLDENEKLSIYAVMLVITIWMVITVVVVLDSWFFWRFYLVQSRNITDH